MVKVLVVDDSPVIFKMIKKALERNGFEVIGHAENGKIGLEMVKKLKPDIITLDITMPIMDGLEMAEELFKSNCSSTVIMLSAMGDNGLLDSARKIGVKYFSPKPINSEKLVELINSTIKNNICS
jgi:two-component system, chemotaxis family, chemotaxis protein CheY